MPTPTSPGEGQYTPSRMRTLIPMPIPEETQTPPRMRTLIPRRTIPEEKQYTPPKFKDLGRLVINVEVWHNLLPTMRSDVGTAVMENVEKLWPGLERGSFPWDIFYKEEDVKVEDAELEDDNDYRVRVMLQFKPKKTSAPITDEASRLRAIQSLCEALHDPTNKEFARIPSLGKGCRALNWKPLTRKPLSWDDQRFGEAFCLQVLASNDWKTLFPESGLQSFGGATRDPEAKYFGSRQSMLLFEDFKFLFGPHINHLQEIFTSEDKNPVTGMTQNPEDTVLYILKSCVSGSNNNQQGSGDLITAFPAHLYQDSTRLSSLGTVELETELTELMELYKTITMEATGGVKRLSKPITDEKTIDQGAVLNIMKNWNSVMQLTKPMYQGSQELQSRHSKNLWDMGLKAVKDTGLAVGIPAALAGAETLLVEAGFSSAAAILADMGLVASASSSTAAVAGGAAAAGSLGILALTILVPAAIAMVKVWKEKKKFEKLSKNIFAAGAHSRALWLFMIVYHMRESGAITDVDAAFMQWADRMADVFGLSVTEDWTDPTYVQEHIQEHAALIEDTLKNMRMDTSLDDID